MVLATSITTTSQPPVEWQRFAELGDQFLIGYSKLDGGTPAVTLFNVGHAVELYLKALLLKDDPQCDVGKKYGHQVDKMILDLAPSHQSALSAYLLRSSVYQKFMHQLVPAIETADPDYEHYVLNQEMYWVARYLADLKYLGSKHKKMPDTYAVFCVPCNPYWLNFFLAMRTELGWPILGMWSDPIRNFLGRNHTNSVSTNFLSHFSTSGP